MNTEKLITLNPGLRIFNINDPEFGRYGDLTAIKISAAYLRRVVDAVEYGQGTSYKASVAVLEEGPVYSELKQTVFGEIDIQAGVCWGDNTCLDGMEYHKSSEVIIAVTDLVLMLGERRDITLSGWHSNRTECFFVPAGTVLELYATTLHFAPCRVNKSPFYAVILLPRGTNTPLEKGPDGLLWMQNKWLLAHVRSAVAAKGAAVRIIGQNLQLKVLD